MTAPALSLRRSGTHREKIVMIEGTLITESQPAIWTVLDFEAGETDARELAEAFAGALAEPGWYVNFQSPAESFVVFPGRIFRYPRGDETGRAEAQECGRQLGIPEPQLDWTV